MQVTVESAEGLTRKLKVILPPEKVQAEIDKRLKSVAENIRLDGFRPGKVPMRVVRQRFGKEIRQEAWGELVQSTFFDAASQHQLTPAGEPSIELKEGVDDGEIGYVATFEVIPTLELDGLDELKVKRPVAEVSHEDVDKMLENLRKQRTVWTEVDRPAQDGDTVHIDFVGKLGGEPFEGGSSENAPLVLGSGSMIDGFEAGLLGASAGEERELELTFPEDYRAEKLKGQTATFEVKVRTVSAPELPEIDEEFAKLYGVEDGSVDTLRSEIAGNMRRELKQKVRGLTKDRALNALLAKHPIDVPAAMVGQEAERLRKQTEAEMAQGGQSFGGQLPASAFEPQAKRRVQLGLMISEIVQKNEITLDRDRVNAVIDEFAESYENPEEIVNYYRNDRQQMEGVENMVLEDQVVDWLMAQGTVEDQVMNFDEAMATKE